MCRNRIGHVSIAYEEVLYKYCDLYQPRNKQLHPFVVTQPPYKIPQTFLASLLTVDATVFQKNTSHMDY